VLGVALLHLFIPFFKLTIYSLRFTTSLFTPLQFVPSYLFRYRTHVITVSSSQRCSKQRSLTSWNDDEPVSRATRARVFSYRERAFLICLFASMNLIEPVAKKEGGRPPAVIDSIMWSHVFMRIECGGRLISPLPCNSRKRKRERERSIFYLHASYTRECMCISAMQGVCTSASIERDGGWKEGPLVSRN